MFSIGKEDKITRLRRLAQLVQRPLDAEQNSLKVTRLSVQHPRSSVALAIETAAV